MKDLFKGYYNLTEKAIDKIWKDGFIALDTNVLFSFYRYSEDTSNELFRVLTRYSKQLWLPYQAAFEFHKNRISVIEEQIKIYEEINKRFDVLENEIIKNVRSPHLNKKNIKKFEANIKIARDDFKRKQNFYIKLLSNDTILNKITALFKNRVGISFSKEEIKLIEKDGEERYKKQIPPGYKDNKKDDNKFGDLIIWKELIKKAKEEKKDFILIIDDAKEDWWLISSGRTLSPRLELLQELFQESKQSCHFYNTNRFLEFSKAKGGTVKKKAIEETKENYFWNPSTISELNPLYSSLNLSHSGTHRGYLPNPDSQVFAQPYNLIELATGSYFDTRTNRIYSSLRDYYYQNTPALINPASSQTKIIENTDVAGIQKTEQQKNEDNNKPVG